VPDTIKLLYRKASKRLAKIMILFMKPSNNTIAEVLIKEMGKTVYREGSWKKGFMYWA
jgi:serine-type D-Ala-D-Ala carboxypeptidase/endopeptidase (penicillin-binding protein 4)